MDTKTPPIPLKPQERVSLSKKTERVADLSLPPLTPYPNNRPVKNNGSSAASRDPSYPVRQHRRHSPPCHHRDDRKRRPYRYGTRYLFLNFRRFPSDSSAESIGDPFWDGDARVTTIIPSLSRDLDIDGIDTGRYLARSLGADIFYLRYRSSEHKTEREK